MTITTHASPGRLSLEQVLAVLDAVAWVGPAGSVLGAMIYIAMQLPPCQHQAWQPLVQGWGFHLLLFTPLLTVFSWMLKGLKQQQITLCLGSLLYIVNRSFALSPAEPWATLSRLGNGVTILPINVGFTYLFLEAAGQPRPNPRYRIEATFNVRQWWRLLQKQLTAAEAHALYAPWIDLWQGVCFTLREASQLRSLSALKAAMMDPLNYTLWGASSLGFMVAGLSGIALAFSVPHTPWHSLYTWGVNIGSGIGMVGFGLKMVQKTIYERNWFTLVSLIGEVVCSFFYAFPIGFALTELFRGLVNFYFCTIKNQPAPQKE